MSFEGQKVGFAPLKTEKFSAEYSNVALQRAECLVYPTRFPSESGKVDTMVGQGSNNFFSESGSVQIS